MEERECSKFILNQCQGDSENGSVLFHQLAVDDFEIMRARNFYRFGCRSTYVLDGYPKYQTRIDVHKFEQKKDMKKRMKRFKRWIAGKSIQENKKMDIEIDSHEINQNTQIIIKEILENIHRLFFELEPLTITDNILSRIRIQQNKRSSGMFTNIIPVLAGIEEPSRQTIAHLISIFEEKIVPLISNVPNKYELISLQGGVITIRELLNTPNKEPKEVNKTIGEVHKFEIKIEKARRTNENSKLFKEYQAFRYGIQCGGIPNIWTDQRLIYRQEQNDDKTHFMGGYHMNYYLDDELVAVGVVDILPSMLCSLFLFYSLKLKEFSFGILSVLFEIEYIKSLVQHFPKFHYYNIGSYEPLSQFSYKAKFRPLELLCPHKLDWIPLDKRIENLFQQKKYSRLCIQGEMPDPDKNFSDEKEVSQFLEAHGKFGLLDKGKIFQFNQLQSGSKISIINEFSGIFIALGKEVCSRSIFYID